MSKSNKMKARQLREKLAAKYNIPYETLKEIEDSPYKFMKEVVSSIDFRDLEDGEVKLLKTNFSLKYLGKLYTTEGRVKHVNNLKEKQYGKQKSKQGGSSKPSSIGED